MTTQVHGLLYVLGTTASALAQVSLSPVATDSSVVVVMVLLLLLALAPIP